MRGVRRIGPAAIGAPCWDACSRVAALKQVLGSLCVAFAVATSDARAGTGANLCCPADLNADGQVGAADIASLLGAWGGRGAADLDSSGVVEASDLAALLGAWGSCPAECPLTLVVGSVAFEDGAPAPGATATTDLGGNGSTDADGGFAFQVEVPDGVTSLEVTIVADVEGVTYGGSAVVRPIALGGVTDAGVIVISHAACTGTFAWFPPFGGQPSANSTIRSLAALGARSGAAPALYVGGTFTAAGGVVANRIVRWDGVACTTLGAGMDSVVTALGTFDDGLGRGPSLYAAGGFTLAGGVPASRIAKWDGTVWSALGSGLSSEANTIATFEGADLGGPALYVGGLFSTAGGQVANNIARWNGAAWSALGSGTNGAVTCIAVGGGDQGLGPALFAGGFFTAAGGVPAEHVAKWDGTEWTALSGGLNFAPYALAIFDDGSGSGPALYAGGVFTTAGGIAANRIAKWDGSSWTPLGSGLTGGIGTSVRALAAFDDGTGTRPTLFVLGEFTLAGGSPANRVARWDGTSWSAVGEGIAALVKFGALCAFDAGAGTVPALYVGGDFLSSPPGTAYLAKWACDAATPSPRLAPVGARLDPANVVDAAPRTRVIDDPRR